MQKLSLSNICLTILISLLLLFAADSFVLQRTLVNTTVDSTIRGDTNTYVSMIKGNSAPSPFKFRILVPFIAGLLPFSPTDSLKFISYLSLFSCYLFILLTCTKLGLNISNSVVGLLSVWASTWHLYNYHNPFLTDAFGLLMLCVMLFALTNYDFLVFLAAALLGVLARETVVFLVPVWLVTKEWRRSISLIAIFVIVLLIPRLLLVSETDPTLVSTFGSIGIRKLQQPLVFGKEVFLSWGFVWFLSMIGVWYLPKDKFALIAVAYISLFGGAVFTSLIATDTGRMFSILTPILAITSAQLYSELINNKSRLMALAFVGLVILQTFVSLPNVIFGAGSWVFDSPRIILLSGEIIFIAFVLVTHHKSLQQEVIGKTTYLFETIRKPFSHIE